LNAAIATEALYPEQTTKGIGKAGDPPIIAPMAPPSGRHSEAPVPLVGTKIRAPVPVAGYHERRRLSGRLDAALGDTIR